MPRLREQRWRHEPTVNAAIELLTGPVDGGLTVDQLKVAWEVERGWLMTDGGRGPGRRPWAHWWFDLGEEIPRDFAAEAVRLAELGLLRDDELAALRERATEARLRVGTAAERISALGTHMEQRPDRDAVALYEAVAAALTGMSLERAASG
jgi:hypothetical protein